MPKSEEVHKDAMHTYCELVKSLEDGGLEREATEVLQDIARDLNHALVSDRKSSATLTVTLKFSADRGVIETVADVKVKYPPRIRGRTMLYVANGKFLSRSNPDQHTMDLRQVPQTETEVRQVPVAAELRVVP